jgi:hypothetical protein
MSLSAAIIAVNAQLLRRLALVSQDTRAGTPTDG